MKSSLAFFTFVPVTLLFATSASCVQQNDQYRYTEETRQQTRANMKQTAQELGQLASDFKVFYGDLQEAVAESGVYSDLGVSQESGLTATDVRVTEKDMIVLIDMPGVNKKDLKLSLKDGKSLIIEGKREPRDTDPTAGGVRLAKDERQKGAFKRTIELPHRAKGKKFKGELENGVLSVTIPRDQAPAEELISIPVE